MRSELQNDVRQPAALLLESARRGSLHHAIIFFGPDRRALHALSESMARTLNCLNGTTGDDCTSCQRIERSIHPDVHRLTVAEDRKLISVEQVRELVASATLRPYEGRTKVFIIEPADAMSTQSANALLKTLEEPAADTAFLLLTRSAELLLPTIRSRAQIIFVGPQIAGGSAVTSEDEESQALAQEILRGLEAWVTKADSGSLLRLAAIIAGGDDVKRQITTYAEILRDLAALPPSSIQNSSAAEKIQALLTARTLLEGAELAMRALSRLAVNADPRLLVEQSLVALRNK